MSQLLDNLLVFRVMHVLLTPIEKSDAFRLGIVDQNGKQIKIPKTTEEKDAFTVLNLNYLWDIVLFHHISKLYPELLVFLYSEKCILACSLKFLRFIIFCFFLTPSVSGVIPSIPGVADALLTGASSTT